MIKYINLCSVKLAKIQRKTGHDEYGKFLRAGALLARIFTIASRNKKKLTTMATPTKTIT